MTSWTPWKTTILICDKTSLFWASKDQGAKFPLLVVEFFPLSVQTDEPVRSILATRQQNRKISTFEYQRFRKLNFVLLAFVLMVPLACIHFGLWKR
jgi:hypothetical protein